jgi:membrane peptidoglycan carboxypeptidase
MSIGYEIGVTALQMTSAFATIANDGIRVQPHVIKEVRHSDEKPKTVTKPEQTKVISAETARDLRIMLSQVVMTGTGRRAQLNGYTAAGKTGTAWKFNPKTRSIDSSKYISSFIGMAPANDPEIVIGVVMDEPKGGARGGGGVAAPVFQEIAQHILQALKVAPDQPVKQEELVAQDIPETPERSIAEKAPADSKPVAGSKPKLTDRPAAPKPKEQKKSNEKKLSEGGKLTATLPADRFLIERSHIRKTKS